MMVYIFIIRARNVGTIVEKWKKTDEKILLKKLQTVRQKGENRVKKNIAIG